MRSLSLVRVFVSYFPLCPIIPEIMGRSVGSLHNVERVSQRCEFRGCFTAFNGSILTQDPLYRELPQVL